MMIGMMACKAKEKSDWKNLLRKMGPVYPVFDKEEPPEDKPEKGGQEEELGHEQGQEEREQHQEEKYLEEACQEAQRERNAAKTWDLRSMPGVQKGDTGSQKEVGNPHCRETRYYTTT